MTINRRRFLTGVLGGGVATPPSWDHCGSGRPAGWVGLRRRAHGYAWHAGGVLTILGVLALTFMMAMYALESRGRGFVLAFALGCALSSTYGFLSGAWPFGAVEAVWTVIALRRWWGLSASQVAPDRS